MSDDAKQRIYNQHLSRGSLSIERPNELIHLVWILLNTLFYMNSCINKTTLPLKWSVVNPIDYGVSSTSGATRCFRYSEQSTFQFAFPSYLRQVHNRWKQLVTNFSACTTRKTGNQNWNNRQRIPLQMTATSDNFCYLNISNLGISSS